MHALPSFLGSAWERVLEALPLVENGARYELKSTKDIVLNYIPVECYTKT